MIGAEAAFHLAGHAVATSFSRYHVLAAPLKMDTYGTGEIVAALSRRRLQEFQKSTDVSVRMDPEVAGGIALILCAGLASERLAASDGLVVEVDPARSARDFEIAREELELAGLSGDTDSYVMAATELLTKYWTHVERLAARLLQVNELHHAEVERIISEASTES